MSSPATRADVQETLARLKRDLTVRFALIMSVSALSIVVILGLVIWFKQ